MNYLDICTEGAKYESSYINDDSLFINNNNLKSFLGEKRSLDAISSKSNDLSKIKIDLSPIPKKKGVPIKQNVNKESSSSENILNEKNPSQTRSARAFQLTLNQIERWSNLLSYLKHLKTINYLIACKELAPETNHPHIHVYIQCSQSIRLCIRKLQGAHIEICRGTPMDNVKYIKKEGNIIFEQGTLRPGNKFTVNDLMNMSNDSLLQLPSFYYNVVRKILAERAYTMKPSLEYIFKKDMHVVYIWGPSGVGKSKYALTMINKLNKGYNIIKHVGDFWHNVKDGDTVCLYDDFRDSDMKPSEFINFIDYNKHPMNIKGSSCINNYQYIFITSVQDPHYIYCGMKDYEEPRKQWLRRMQIIHLEKLEDFDNTEFKKRKDPDWLKGLNEKKLNDVFNMKILQEKPSGELKLKRRNSI